MRRQAFRQDPLCTPAMTAASAASHERARKARYWAGRSSGTDPKVRAARRVVETAIRADLAQGRGIVSVARAHKVGVAVVQRLKAEMAIA
jgi:hypothetical protein